MNIGLGTAALGRPQYINIRQEQKQNIDLESFKKQSTQVLEDAYNLGVRYFDTAPGYGMAEQLILKWLQTKDDSSIEVATKWGYTYVANFNPEAKVHEVKEHSLAKLNEQWAISKAILPYLKVYQIHSATLETGVLNNKNILDRLAFLKDEHRLKIGISTTGANQVEVIKKALDVTVDGKQLFDTFQVTYNILDQSLSDVYSKLNDLGKKVIVKEALANGRLFKQSNFIRYEELYETLDKFGRKYQVGTDVIALKFCEQTLDNSIILSGASKKEHLKSNLELNKVTLSSSEINQLKEFKVDTTYYWKERQQLNWN